MKTVQEKGKMLKNCRRLSYKKRRKKHNSGNNNKKKLKRNKRKTEFTV